jgi:hypothetical protein
MSQYIKSERRILEGETYCDFVWFIPDETLEGFPCFVKKGRPDNRWIKYQKESEPDFSDKKMCESIVGHSLQPFPEST